MRFWSMLAGTFLLIVTGCARPEQRRAATAQLLDAEIGDHLCLPGEMYLPPSVSRLVVIVESATCAACTANEPSERIVVSNAAAAGFPVYWVLPNRSDQAERATRLKKAGHNVVRTDLHRFGIARTPAIAMIDTTGLVLGMHLGAVSTTAVERVWSDLVSGLSVYKYDRISRSDFEDRARIGAVQAIALTRPVHGFPSSEVKYRLIPLAELEIRSRYELNENQPVFIDCDTATPQICQEALFRLSPMFSRLVAINQPRRSGICEDLQAGVRGAETSKMGYFVL